MGEVIVESREDGDHARSYRSLLSFGMESPHSTHAPPMSEMSRLALIDAASRMHGFFLLLVPSFPSFPPFRPILFWCLFYYLRICPNVLKC